jgi:SHS2 domain-containing protein
MGYRIIEHTADTGIEAAGRTLEELFANAALGMTEIIFGPCVIAGKESVNIDLEGTDSENLMVRWLSEVLHYARQGYLFTGLNVDKIEGNRLRASGTAIKDPKIPIKTEVKMVTYHGLKIEKGNKGYKARIIFDV